MYGRNSHLPSDIKAGNLGKLEEIEIYLIIVVCQTGQSSQRKCEPSCKKVDLKMLVYLRMALLLGMKQTYPW